MSIIELLTQFLVLVGSGVTVAIISACVLALLGKKLFSSWMEHPRLKKIEKALKTLADRSDKMIEKLDEFLRENGKNES
jgi:hypothetical protein